MAFRRIKPRKQLAAMLLSALFGIGYAGTASANLILVGEVGTTGEGYGNVTNLLSMQLSGGAGTATDVEGGSVTWNGTTNVITQDQIPGTVSTDPNKTSTQTFGTIGLSGATAAGDLRLIWDPAEVGSAAGQITHVDELTLLVFNQAGTQIFSASIAAPVIHDSLTNPGLGAGDFVYALDATQAAQLQALLIGDFSGFRIGLDTTASFVDDGPDTWLVAKGTSTPVPEPASPLLIGLGLLAVAGMRKRARE